MAFYSNTKLDAVQKAELKELRANQKSVKVITNGQTTIAYKNTGKVVIFATSVTAPEEQKFRRKVGEFFARMRFESENVAMLTPTDFEYMCDSLSAYE